MSDSIIIFRDLPATFPEKDKYQKPSVIGSLIFHGFLIVTVLAIPLLLPQSISQRELLVTLVAPIAPPPPPPPPAPVQAAIPAMRPAAKPEVRPANPAALVMPSAIPKEIAKLVEEPIAPVGFIGGVPGGVPGGVTGGVLGGILASNANMNALATPAPPPPPPPPPPKMTSTGPVRVGGNVQEPRPLKMVPPVYPPLASKARIAGTVVLEATLTADGTVEAIHVISGHPLLIDAAIAAVKQWQYEPTLLNGEAVSVILTARVHFRRATLS